ncbi:hypothetical protein PQO01_13790 [Lentisphaera marina]|jgi:hypothetical protein|uniref:hypothetical protein n=1 Tax=Lentisphaera marina TaxID=1111041 RepID=UPI0023657975|nr:hypothetical protein [Lentisphaera marina]MDD7986018.1 hypothetical protein [Lentisphaera marina]
MNKYFILTLALFLTQLNAADFSNKADWALTTKAWEAFVKKDHAEVLAYTNKCIELYAKKADKHQAAIIAGNFENEQSQAVNFVATCMLIQAQSCTQQGEKEKAKGLYKQIIEKYPAAIVSDKNGTWSVHKAAKKKIAEL